MAEKLNKTPYLHTAIHYNIVKTTHNITIKKQAAAQRYSERTYKFSKIFEKYTSGITF